MQYHKNFIKLNKIKVILCISYKSNIKIATYKQFPINAKGRSGLFKPPAFVFSLKIFNRERYLIIFCITFVYS